MPSKCPHCGGMLFMEWDGYVYYYLCIVCSRQWELNGKPRRVTPRELEEQEGIALDKGSSFL